MFAEIIAQNSDSSSQEVTNSGNIATSVVPVGHTEADSNSQDITDQLSQEAIPPSSEPASSFDDKHHDSDTGSTDSAAIDLDIMEPVQEPLSSNSNQDCKNDDLSTSSSDSVFIINKTRALKVKEHLNLIGLSDDVYNVNLSTYYPLVSQDDDLDFINFTDIVNNSCSVSLDNLSAEDIKFEQEQLKSSSPVHSDQSNVDITSSTNSTQSDNENRDPTYGTAKKGKPSLHPRRKPSSKRIAMQKLINKTRQKLGTSKGKSEYYPCTFTEL